MIDFAAKSPAPQAAEPPVRISEVFRWFYQGAMIGSFISMAAALLTEGELLQFWVAGVAAGVVVWPILAAVLTVTRTMHGVCAALVRVLAQLAAGVILAAFLGSVLLFVGLKLLLLLGGI
jgi:hypothetical protein